MSDEEYLKAAEKLGAFEIVSTKDLPKDQAVSEYYKRSSIE